MDSPPYKILSSSDSLLLHTGYQNVCKNIFKRLAYNPNWQCYHLGWQYFGEEMNYHPDSSLLSPRIENSIRLLPSSGRHPFSGDVLQPYIKMIAPDITFLLADSFMLYPWMIDDSIARGGIDFSPSHSIFYYPSDGFPLPLKCENILKKFEYTVSMSKFAQKQVLDNYGIDSLYIPHGCDTSLFRPADEQEKIILRNKWSQKLNINLMDKFVLIYVGRNQGRKAPGELLKSFAKFAKDKKDVVLIMSTDPEDPAGMNPQNIMTEFIVYLKIEDKVRYTGTRYWYGLPENEIAELMRLSDLYVSTTTGEGWCLPMTEAISSSTPVVIPDFTTPEEILGDNKCGIRVPLYNHEDDYYTRGTFTGTWAVERGFVDKKKFVESLNHLYENRDLIKKMGENGRKKVLKEYDWNDIYKEWLKMFTKIVER